MAASIEGRASVRPTTTLSEKIFREPLVCGLISLAVGLTIGYVGTNLSLLDYPVVILSSITLLFSTWLWWSQRNILHPAYLFVASVVVLYILRPVFVFGDPSRSQLGYSFLGEAPETLWIVTLGVLATYAYLFCSLRREVVPTTPKYLRPQFISGVAEIFIVLLATVAFSVWLIQQGGISFLFSGRSDSTNEAIRDSSAYLYFAPQTLLALGVLRIINPGNRSQPWNLRIATALIILSQVGAIGFGNRIILLPAVLATILAVLIRLQCTPRWWAMVAAILVLFVVVIALPRELRVAQGQERGSVSNALDVNTAFTEFISNQDTAMLDNLSILVGRVPAISDYSYGETYIAAAVRFVPRSIWQDKPRVADEQINSELFNLPEYNFGFSFGYFGEPYYNFGFPGVLLAGLLAGFLLTKLARTVGRNTSPIAVSAALVSFAYIIIYMRGGLGVDFHRQLIMLSPLLVLKLTERSTIEGSGGIQQGPGLVSSSYRA